MSLFDESQAEDLDVGGQLPNVYEVDGEDFSPGASAQGSNSPPLKYFSNQEFEESEMVAPTSPMRWEFIE
eukprot:672953-Rhodomonas_salina.1